MSNNNDFWAQEKVCEEQFLRGGPFYMISTEELPSLLFESEEDFKEGTNMVALALAGLRLSLLIDVQMNNHLHQVAEGAYEEAVIFAERLRKQMRAFLRRKGRVLKKWDIQIKEIKELRYLRNAILYVARNPYVAHRDATPLGYRWGSAHLMFNRNIADYNPGIPYKELGFREKRQLCHSHDINLPEHYKVSEGMLLRHSFVSYKRAQDFFISANQFFQWLSRKKESDVETARWIGESILLPNDDVFRIVSDWYGVKSIMTLKADDRVQAARRMKAELSSNNRQIAQVLRLPLRQIDLLFPVAR